MGSWQLEVGRMLMYILFPIGTYYYFNQTENIEQWLINEKKKCGTSSMPYEEFLEILDKYNAETQKQKIEEMEAKYN